MSSLSSFLPLLEKLIAAPAVVGSEHSFFRIIQKELEARGARVTRYQGLLVAQGNKEEAAEKTYFSAHIDRHGLVCTGPNEFQYAAFVAGARSDLLNTGVSEKFMNKVGGRFDEETLIAYQPWSGKTLGTGKVLDAKISEQMNNLLFETEGLEEIEAGTPVAFAGKLQSDEQVIQGQLDNVLGVAALIDLYEQDFSGTTFFTAEEEAGKSWRYLLNWFRRHEISTDRLIIVDTSPYPSEKDARAQDIVLRHKDNNATFNSELGAKLSEICDTLGIPFHFKDDYIAEANMAREAESLRKLSLGTIELGRIIEGSEGQAVHIQGSSIQLPTTDYHTLQETASKQAIESLLRLLTAIGA